MQHDRTGNSVQENAVPGQTLHVRRKDAKPRGIFVGWGLDSQTTQTCLCMTQHLQLLFVQPLQVGKIDLYLSFAFRTGKRARCFVLFAIAPEPVCTVKTWAAKFDQRRIEIPGRTKAGHGRVRGAGRAWRPANSGRVRQTGRASGILRLHEGMHGRRGATQRVDNNLVSTSTPAKVQSDSCTSYPSFLPSLALQTATRGSCGGFSLPPPRPVAIMPHPSR